MYNRYIPQPDGSYRRSRQPDAPQNVPAPPRQEERREEPRREPPSECRPQPQKDPREEPPCSKAQSCPHMHRQGRPIPPPPRQKKPPQQPQEQKDFFGIGSFLRQLLPKDFDTEDLLIVLLLLLMSGDGGEDQNFALLTLGLYLFM
ncbi:MAG: hypothetical protein ACI3V5_06330 [Faecousia sp.]